jgi:hypothetical protein
LIKLDNQNAECSTTWQQQFLEILPEIDKRLRRKFHFLDREARDEAVEEGTVHCLLSYSHLFERGRTESISASTLSWYAALQVKRGRPAAGRMNGKDPLSRYAQVGQGIRIESGSKWISTLVEDKRAGIADQVAAKLDVSAWFATLTERMKQIAEDLAFGGTTSEVAHKHGLTPGRVSQLRRTLEASWLAFQHEAAPALAR